MREMTKEMRAESPREIKGSGFGLFKMFGPKTVAKLFGSILFSAERGPDMGKGN